MESSRRALLNDVTEHRPILKNNQNTYHFVLVTHSKQVYSIPQIEVFVFTVTYLGWPNSRVTKPDAAYLWAVVSDGIEVSGIRLGSSDARDFRAASDVDERVTRQTNAVYCLSLQWCYGRLNLGGAGGFIWNPEALDALIFNTFTHFFAVGEEAFGTGREFCELRIPAFSFFYSGSKYLPPPDSTECVPCNTSRMRMHQFKIQTTRVFVNCQLLSRFLKVAF